jgi:hypothetical protein
MGHKRFIYQNNKHHWHLNCRKLKRLDRFFALIDAEYLGRGDSPEVDAPLIFENKTKIQTKGRDFIQ